MNSAAVVPAILLFILFIAGLAMLGIYLDRKSEKTDEEIMEAFQRDCELARRNPSTIESAAKLILSAEEQEMRRMLNTQFWLKMTALKAGGAMLWEMAKSAPRDF